MVSANRNKSNPPKRDEKNKNFTENLKTYLILLISFFPRKRGINLNSPSPRPKKINDVKIPVTINANVNKP